MSDFGETTSAPSSSVWDTAAPEVYPQRDTELLPNPYAFAPAPAPVTTNVAATTLAAAANVMTTPAEAANGAAVRRRERAERQQARHAGEHVRGSVAEAATPLPVTPPTLTAPPITSGLSLGGGVALRGVTDLPQGERPGTALAAAQEALVDGDPRLPQPPSPLTPPLMRVVRSLLPTPAPDPLQPMPAAYLPPGR